MKRAALTFFTIYALAMVAYAGPEPYSGKEMKEAVVPPPCPEWYADNEWNVAVWGTYAFTGTNGTDEFRDPFAINRAIVTANYSPFFSSDRYLETDHAWGGGVDLKYFFHRYFGLGVEGFVVDAKRNEIDIEAAAPVFLTVTKDEDHRAIGGALGTFTIRYPFHCCRFAPYAWAGGGAILNGGEKDVVTIDNRALTVTTNHTNRETKGMGQFGGGLEIRLTRHIGWMNDFSWNVVDGPKNNFGMVRSGINFAF